MANNISSMLNSRLRFSGLASGLDTDSIIKQLMRIESMKVDKVKQDRQMLEWKRDNYRDVTNLIRGFKDSYFDVLKPASNFRSESAFATYDVTSGDESVVTAKAVTGAASTTHSITVRKLATAARIEKTVADYHVTSSVEGSADITDFNLKGKQMKINYDGTSKIITLEDYTGMADLESKLQIAVDRAVGTGKIDVIANGSKLEFEPLVDGSTFMLSEVSNNLLPTIGFSDGQKNYITGSSLTHPDLSVANGKIKVKLGADEKEIEIAGLTGVSTLDDLRYTLEAALNDNASGFGAGSVSVKLNGDKLEIISNTGAGLVMSSAADNDVLGQLGINNGASAAAVSSSVIDLSGDEQYKSFILSVNGADKEIIIDKNYGSLNDLAVYIESKLTGVDVSVVDGKLNFAAAAGDKLEFKKGPENTLEKLGFTAADNKGNRIPLDSSLESIEKYFSTAVDFNPAANVSFVINGVNINLKKTFSEATTQDVMNAVNTSSANVELKYDSLNDKFTLASKTTGVAETISIADTDAVNGLLKALGIEIANLKPGEDAEFDLDGVTGMKRGTNEFTIDGVSYTLKDVPDPVKEVSISVKANADALVEKIKEFVGKYNELIDKLNAEYSEKRDRDYLPLTDEQKEAMSEDDIKKWEEKTKEGLLKGDSILGKIIGDMRKALYDPVDGASASLYKIGITTGTYEQKGKLVIDEDKLKTAITNNIDAVTQLFTNDSEISYEESFSDSSKRQTRYKEIGLGQRLYDIIQDNIRTTRDADGNKGILLEKAGITGDLSEFENILSKEIDKKDTLIDTLLLKLVDKEDALYRKFTAMETAINQMNSQSAWLSQQFGGSQQ
ncbi:MAG TPA: flagellar filament capping protein FliD [Clostridia bacterium]|nr:flagellar filament capping protein FliD [Clostridia bacterium]